MPTTPPTPDVPLPHSESMPSTGSTVPPNIDTQRAEPLPQVQSTAFHNTSSPADQAESKSNPWETCLDYAKKYVDGETEVWKDEVDKLLIFASLFSGVVGAFAVESYHNIKQDPAETTALLLRSLLVLQLNLTNPQPNLVIDLDPKTSISSSAQQINIYNFLSLILSLSVVMAGILCLQWIREYTQDPGDIPGPRREQLGIRFMRREGMKKWHVITILKILPLILLLSLLLFFAGIIELLQGVDKKATIVASVTVAIVSSFMLITMALPTIQSFQIHFFPRIRLSECPYKSPQAWIFHRIFTTLIFHVKRTIPKFRRILSKDASDMNMLDFQNWCGYDWLVYSSHTRAPRAMSNVGFGIHWLGELYLQEKFFAETLYQCIQDTSLHISLRDILGVKKDTRRAAALDRAFMWSPSVLDQETRGSNPESLKQAYVANFTVFQTLAHLAEKIERGHPPTVLLKQRLELFFSINQLCLDQDVDCPLVNDADQRDIISYETRRNLLGCISKLMQEDVGVNESHLCAIGHILELEADMPNPDIELFTKALEVLQDWMYRQGWDPDGDPRLAASTVWPKLRDRAVKLERSIHLQRRLVTSRRQARE